MRTTNCLERVILPKDSLLIREVGFDIAGKSEDFVDLAILQTKETYQRFEKEILAGLQMMNAPFVQKLQENYSFSFEVDQEIQEKGYDKPSLFIAGKQDQVVGFQQLAQLSHYYVVLDAHDRLVFAGQPDQFGAEWDAPGGVRDRARQSRRGELFRHLEPGSRELAVPDYQDIGAGVDTKQVDLVTSLTPAGNRGHLVREAFMPTMWKRAWSRC